MSNVLEKIYKAGLKFLVPLTADETNKLIVDEAMKLVKVDYGSIFLYQNGKLERIYTTYPVLRQIALRPKGYTYRAFHKRQAYIVDIRYKRNVNPKIKKIGVKSDLLTPLFYRNKSIGVLSLLSSKSGYFTNAHLETLKLFAAMATLAIRKAQLYDETKKALEARDLFISMAAHELRTPITTISGYSQLLYSKLSGANTPESKWTTDLSWEAIRLSFLVNELLEVERIKSGQFQYTFRECSLREVIMRSISDFRFTHPNHKVILHDKLDGMDIVIGDFNKLLQLVTNLLDNAAKFSPPDKEIFIELKSRLPHICLVIKDQGRGIAKKDMPEIFEKFFKGSDHAEEGIGLGLFLAKNIIRQHHGVINIRSKENKGTTVEVKLPRVRHA